MDTETGRIYSPDEMQAALHPQAGASRQELSEAIALHEGLRSGIITPVSDLVAQKVLLGERELRRRKRRQQHDSRRRNR